MNVACDYEAPMQMLTTEKYIATGTPDLRQVHVLNSEFRNLTDFWDDGPKTWNHLLSKFYGVLILVFDVRDGSRTKRRLVSHFCFSLFPDNFCLLFSCICISVTVGDVEWRTNQELCPKSGIL